jgi:transcriptional regulator with XRE-family HTH domain
MGFKEIILGFVIIFMLGLIVLSAVKIHIFFRSFLFLSKKKNYDKANYIVNSSFYQYYYNNPYLYGKINIEMLFMVMLVLLLIVAVVGNLAYGATNYGYLNYYYGDNEEYDFVDYYIKIIMILGVIYFMSYVSWYMNDKVEDDKLDINEAALKTFVLANIDYTYLFDYYITTISKNNAYNINTFLTPEKITTLEDPNNLFKLCFTIHILSPARTEFANIKAEIFQIFKNTYEKSTQAEQATADAFAPKITPALQGSTFYIIANYNNNNSAVLPPLDKLIKDTLGTATNTTLKAEINITITAIQNNNPSVSDMISKYETGRAHFIDTIKVYKEIYGKYYTYYIYSVLITNFLITYSILIFMYIFIKWMDDVKSPYSIYTFKSDIKTYGYYILILYYLLTSPIILFGAS